MTKGKFGLNLAAIAVIAFLFTALQQPVAVLLVAGFALLAEKDEWLNRQAMQALLLTVAYSLTVLVADWIFGGLARFFGWVRIYRAQSAMSQADSIVSGALSVACVALCVVAVWRSLHGKDANLPLLSKLAYGGLTAVPVQNEGRTAAPVQPAAKQAEPKAAAPAPSVQPAERAAKAPVLALEKPAAPPAAPPSAGPEKVCPSCGAVLPEDSVFCPECGAKIK